MSSYRVHHLIYSFTLQLLIVKLCNSEKRYIIHKQRLKNSFVEDTSSYTFVHFEYIIKGGKHQQQWTVDCDIYASGILQATFETVSPKSSYDISLVTAEEMEQLVNDCTLFKTRRHKLAPKRTFLGLKIFPGTKWCGSGNISSTGADLGKFRDTDLCCRTHDHCFDSIESGDKKYGLKNSGFYTKSHCNCDGVFYRCLKRIRSEVADEVGSISFNLMQFKCFKKEYPIIKCLKSKGGACQEYLLDKKKPKIYQFFDAKYFPFPNRWDSKSYS